MNFVLCSFQSTPIPAVAQIGAACARWISHALSMRVDYSEHCAKYRWNNQAGLMFWLILSTLLGSYFFLISTRRA